MSSDLERDEPPRNGEHEDESTSADGIFALTDYKLRRPLRREFKPWHKPRKQFVRQDQWGKEIEWLLSRKPEGDRSGLCYLGLPGPDLLDVRYIYGRFCAEGRQLTFLGFDESARPASPSREALSVSLDEFRRLAHVDRRSNVLPDDFRKLADDNSIAWDRANTLGPFDIINLDLCKHIGLDPPEIDGSIYSAIHRLLGLQNRRLRPWSLFITSRISKQNFSPEVLSALLCRLRDNIETCHGFKQALEERIGELNYTDSAVAASNEEEFLSTTAMVLSKWLLGLAQSMQCLFSVASVAVYRVYRGASCPDMLSLALRFEPMPTIGADPARLATASSPVCPDECTQAARIPRAIAAMVNVDDLLSADTQLWKELRDDTARLLRDARYDPMQYLAWANQQSEQ